jgi:hypothetical protein
MSFPWRDTCLVKDMLILPPVHSLEQIRRFWGTSPPSRINVLPSHRNPFHVQTTTSLVVYSPR